LKKNLKEDTAQAVLGFIKAFLLSMPTGKQNSYANRTVPDFAYITLRTDQPVNLAGAFERPVYTRQEGYMEKSVQSLKEYAHKTYSTFVEKPEETYCIGREEKDLGMEVSLKDLLDILKKSLDTFCEEE